MDHDGGHSPPAHNAAPAPHSPAAGRPAGRSAGRSWHRKNEAGPVADRPVALPFAVPESHWDEATTVGKGPADLLLFRSNLLGADLTVTNFGGGNTSAKIIGKDPLTGEDVEV